MYKGYNVTLSKDSIKNDSYLKIGKDIANSQQKNIDQIIDGFTNSEGELDAVKMQADWFPQIKCDVFISHSHKDLDLALRLGGLMHDRLGLAPFIDYSVWKYANDLLKLLDKKYCWKESSRTYDYDKRNLSTSHVHMMLSTALSNMIDKTECIFFLNTPHSMTPADVINGKDGSTLSPWIYSEISMTRLVRKRSPAEHRSIKKSKVDELREVLASINVRYPLNTDHLTNLSTGDLKTWLNTLEIAKKPNEALDFLYSFKS